MKQLVFTLLITTQVAFGQIQDSAAVVTLPTKTDFRFGFISELGTALVFGYGNLSNYRSFLKANQIKSTLGTDPFLSVGLGGRYKRLKVMAQTGVSVGFAPAPTDPGSGSLVARKLNAGYGGVMIGYDIVNARNRRVYVNAGVGGMGYEFSIYRQANQIVSFQNILQQTSTGNVPSLSFINTYWDVNVEYCQREKRKRSAQNVIRVGYRRGFRPELWTSDAFQLTGALTDRISQVYIQGAYYFSSNYTKLGKR